jgi:hypothetical protein
MLLVYKGALWHCNHEVGIEYAVGVDLSVLKIVASGSIETDECGFNSDRNPPPPSNMRAHEQEQQEEEGDQIV